MHWESDPVIYVVLPLYRKSDLIHTMIVMYFLCLDIYGFIISVSAQLSVTL